MSRAYPLTDAQKSIIELNSNLFDSKICNLPGMEGTSVRQVRDYRKRITRESDSEHRQMADHIERYIQHHGLPQQFGDVILWARYLREKG